MTFPYQAVPTANGGAQPTQSPYPGQPGQVPQQFQQPQPNVPQTQVIPPENYYQSAPPVFTPQQQQVDPRAPQYAPAWQGGQVQPQAPTQGAQGGAQGGQYPAQGGAQPQYPGQQLQPQRQPNGQFAPQQQAPAQGIQFDQQGRMTGAGLPQELQGKTMQEAIGLYGVMRNSYVQTQSQRQPTAQGQQSAPQAQAPTATPQRGSFWSDPEGTLDRMLDQRLAPILQQSQEQSIEGARNSIAQMYPQHFANYEGEIYARLNGLPPETLANPRAWQLALEQVVGEKAMAGQFNSAVPQGQPNTQGFVQTVPPQGQPAAPQQYQPQIQPPQYPRAVLPWERAQQPVAPQPFFTESPTAGANGGFEPNGAGGQLNPAQVEVARRMGLTPQQYVQGMGARY